MFIHEAVQEAIVERIVFLETLLQRNGCNCEFVCQWHPLDADGECLDHCGMRGIYLIARMWFEDDIVKTFDLEFSSVGFSITDQHQDNCVYDARRRARYN